MVFDDEHCELEQAFEAMGGSSLTKSQLVRFMNVCYYDGSDKSSRDNVGFIERSLGITGEEDEEELESPLTFSQFVDLVKSSTSRSDLQGFINKSVSFHRVRQPIDQSAGNADTRTSRYTIDEPTPVAHEALPPIKDNSKKRGRHNHIHIQTAVFNLPPQHRSSTSPSFMASPSEVVMMKRVFSGVRLAELPFRVRQELAARKIQKFMRFVILRNQNMVNFIQAFKEIKAMRQCIGFISVRAVRGRGLVPKDGNSMFGTSDPYLRLLLDGNPAQTTTVKFKTLNPVWNELFSFKVMMITDVLIITCWDKDYTQQDELIGRSSLSIAWLLVNCNSGNHFLVDEQLLIKQKSGGKVTWEKHPQHDNKITLTVHTSGFAPEHVAEAIEMIQSGVCKRSNTDDPVLTRCKEMQRERQKSIRQRGKSLPALRFKSMSQRIVSPTRTGRVSPVNESNQSDVPFTNTVVPSASYTSDADPHLTLYWKRMKRQKQRKGKKKIKI